MVSQSIHNAILLAIVALPICVLLLPVVAGTFGLSWLARRAARLIPLAARKLKLTQNNHGRLVYELIQEDEYDRLAHIADRRRDIDCWFVPNPAWSTAAKLKGAKVCLFPDFVFAEHTTGFTAQLIVGAREKFRSLARSDPDYICFSRHVMERHAKDHFGIREPRLHLIRHAPICYDPPAADEGRQTLREYLANHFTAARAHSTIERLHIYPYLRSFDLTNVTYIFVSTQLRPYKNVLRVVEAVERLIRCYYMDVKLVLTGILDFHNMTPDVTAFIQRKALWLDVLSLPRVPKHIHELLYKFAALSVHPSFFEGGFPFVFGESVGVGTPCLLARNAAVTELLRPEEIQSFTFDPYLDPDRLAILLQSAIGRRRELVTEQQATLERMSERTWRTVAAEYAEVFTNAAQAARAQHMRERNRLPESRSTGDIG